MHGMATPLSSKLISPLPVASMLLLTAVMQPLLAVHKLLQPCCKETGYARQSTVSMAECGAKCLFKFTGLTYCCDDKRMVCDGTDICGYQVD